MVVKGDEARGGKKSKDCISVLLACSYRGEKLKPLVISNNAKVCCFRWLASPCLPVIYVSNKKAWMTSEVFLQWLDQLNNKMCAEGRFILLFINNCAAHLDVIHSNVKLVFLPPQHNIKAAAMQCSYNTEHPIALTQNCLYVMFYFTWVKPLMLAI